jgi:hypothetical protein
MGWKGCRSKRSYRNLKGISHPLPGGTEESHKLSQDNRSAGWDLNPGPPEYEAGVLTARPWCWVVTWKLDIYVEMKVTECMAIWYFFISCGWNTKFHIPSCLTVNVVSRWNELTIGTVRHAPLVTLPHDRQWNWWGRQLSWFDLRFTASTTARMYLTTSFRRAEVPSSRSATLNTAGKRISQTDFHFLISLIITTNQMQVNVL